MGLVPTSCLQQPRRRRAFTLMELMVVMTIIGILMAILLPVLSRGKVKAKRLKCQSNLKQIATSLRGFSGENSTYMPWHLTGSNGLPPRFIPKNIFAAYNYPSLAADLGSARILNSPCDPNREGVNRRMTLGRGNNGKGAIQNAGISYFVHHGGDEMAPGTILAGTRNANYSSSTNYYYVAHGTQANRGNGKIASSRAAMWLGSYHRSRGMGMLRANQGQLALSDGSAKQVNNAEFSYAFRVHATKITGHSPSANNNIGAP